MQPSPSRSIELASAAEALLMILDITAQTSLFRVDLFLSGDMLSTVAMIFGL